MQKNAAHLERGDLLFGVDGVEMRPRFVASVVSENHLPNVIVEFFGQHASDTWSSDVRVDFYSGLLSPAQMHADDLLSHLRITLETLNKGGRLAPHYAEEIHALLTQIEPPKPPSAKELAEALEALTTGAVSQAVVNDLLARCRKAKIIPYTRR